MTSMFDKILGLRWFALFAKELRQITRNRRLIIILVIPPTVNIVLFGFALNPAVTDLRLGIVDESRSKESREVISALTESRSFKVSSYYLSTSAMSSDLSAGELDAALVIPTDFSRKRSRGETANIQFIVDAVNTNTATIAAGYAARIIADLDQQIIRAQRRVSIAPPTAQPQATTTDPKQGPSPSQQVLNLPTVTPPPAPNQPNVTPRIALLYNPGLENSWFIATGLIGALLVIQGSLVAAASMVREKEMGTVEQLLMTPAEAGEIITAKIAPIFVILSCDIVLALTVAWLVFGVPVHGSLFFFFVSGSLCVLSGIGIGTLVATFVNSQQQAQLMGFFINPPLVLLSGATTPIEAMPPWLQPLTLLNPVRHFATIVRGILLKGTGFDELYINFFALLGFCILLVGISTWRFRKQLR